MKVDLALKRKFAEQGEAIEKEFLTEAKKMTTTMEQMASAMTNCFQMMQTMLQTQFQQQAFTFQNQHPAAMSMQGLQHNFQNGNQRVRQQYTMAGDPRQVDETPNNFLRMLQRE